MVGCAGIRERCARCADWLYDDAMRVEGYTFGFKMAQAAVRANGNVDALMFALVEYANKYNGGAENSMSIAVRRFVGAP